MRHPGRIPAPRCLTRSSRPSAMLRRCGVVLVAVAGLGAPTAHADAPASTMRSCDSPWMTEAGVMWGQSVDDPRLTTAGGPAVNFMVSMKPTKRARSVPLPVRRLGRVYQWIWGDLHRCVSFPGDLSADQEQSLFEQMRCHVVYSTGFIFKNGGRTWDFEAWRPNVPTREALDPRNKCNWGPPTGPPLPAEPARSGRPQTFQNRATGFCLDSNAPGEVYTLGCNGGGYQAWRVARDSRGVSLTNVATGRCLDSNAARSVYTLPCNGGTYQRWQVVRPGDGTITFQNAATGFCLDSNANRRVYTHPCNSGAYQRWS